MHSKELQMTLNPANTIITFDIHGVLFKPDYKKILSLLWHNKKVVIVGCYLLNPKFTYNLLRLMYKRAVPEEYFITFTHTYPSLEQFKPLAIELSNAQYPVGNMVSLAHTLKAKGYSLHIMSNIGTLIFNDLAQKHPDIFNLFDMIHVPSEHTGFITKRDPGAFAHYLAVANTGDKKIVLIDDNKKNVARSANVGIIGIYFKNSQQLMRDLHEFKIL